MSWLSELRDLPKDPSVWYDLLSQHSLYFSVLARICPFEIVRTKPTGMQFDIMRFRLTNNILVQSLEEFPHLLWMRENLSPNKAAAVFTPTIDTITAKLVKPGSGTWLQGFMFADPADAVTFKLMWSAELA